MTCQRTGQVLPAWKSLLGLLAAFAIYCLLPATPVLADAAACPGGLTVEGTALETEIACARYRVVQAYFDAMGYDGHPPARVRFEETVHVDDVPNGYEVTGQFLADQHLIEITSLDSRAPARLLHWGQPWSADMAASILDHELVHLYVDALRTAPLPHAWNEFVAYAVQFEVMDPELRRTILSAYPDTAPYSDPARGGALGRCRPRHRDGAAGDDSGVKLAVRSSPKRSLGGCGTHGVTEGVAACSVRVATPSVVSRHLPHGAAAGE